MNCHNIAFGLVLRALRHDKGLTQERLAFAAGLDRTYISLLELGQRSPTLDTIFALCESLDLSFAELAATVQDHLDASHGARSPEDGPVAP